ncbi:FCD domain-containing protein [Nonomuraea fuscirosea]|uniref:FCD domain-containing protein n=1 Tax=Nonomuraea fuscirosea TaxID=1291556 RepID=UPI0033D371F9
MTPSSWAGATTSATRWSGIAAALSARGRLVHSAGERRGFAATHRAVLDAVREGDPDAAETAMRDLLAQAGRDEAAL